MFTSCDIHNVAFCIPGYSTKAKDKLEFTAGIIGTNTNMPLEWFPFLLTCPNFRSAKYYLTYLISMGYIFSDYFHHEQVSFNFWYLNEVLAVI